MAKIVTVAPLDVGVDINDSKKVSFLLDVKPTKKGREGGVFGHDGPGYRHASAQQSTLTRVECEEVVPRKDVNATVSGVAELGGTLKLFLN